MNMKSVYRPKYCKYEDLTIKSFDIPKPASKEYLIKVEYTSVNRTDGAIVTGKPWIMRLFLGLFKPRNPIPGTDFAGTIIEAGEEAKAFPVGTRVFGFQDEGLASQSQYMVIKESKPIAEIPANCNFKTAAASLEGAHYAINGIISSRANKESKVLVYGATGAIGSAALQILKAKGNWVTVVGNTKNVEMLKGLGADRVWDYQSQDFTADPDKYDVIFDAVGKSRFKICKPLLKKGGVYLSSELGPCAENIFLPLGNPLRKTKSRFPIPKNVKRSLKLIQEQLEKGGFVPVIDKIYTLDKVGEAYTYANSGNKTGNVLLQLGDSEA